MRAWSRALWRLCVVACLLGLGPAGGGCGRARPGDAAPRAAAQPTLRLFVVTDLAGVLEPCGCSRRSRGGLDRLAAALARARAEPIPSLFLLAGPMLFDPAHRDAGALPQQERWEAAAMAELLRDLHADAAMPGASDVALAGSEIEALARGAGFPWLLGARAASPGAFASSVQRELAGLKLALVGGALEPEPALPEPPERGLQRLQREVERARSSADVVIALLSGAGPQLDAALAQSGADLLVGGGELRARPEPVRRSGRSALLNAGRQGEQLLIVDLWWSGRGRPFELGRPAPGRASAVNWLHAELVTLDRDAARDPLIARTLERLAEKINGYNATAYGQSATAEVAPGASSYAGSRPCAACHTAAYLWWQRSGHGRAYATLQRLDKEYNLDCVGCHVTGYGEPGGASVARVEGLEGAGCESCHGAAAAHVDNPRDAAWPLHVTATATCRSCHDQAHSPEFEERTYRAKLKAPGHGSAVTRRR